MSGSFYIALSGLNAAQTGLDTVSQNIANAATPGYTRERVNQSALVDQSSGVGQGVLINSVSQVSSGFQNQVLFNSTAQNSAAVSLSQVLSSAQNFLNEPSSNGISEQLANFYSSFDGVANAPNQLAPRQQLVANAQTLANTFNTLSQSFNSLYNSTVSSIGSDISAANAQISQLAALNQQITQAGPTNSNTLIDQVNQLAGDLSSSLGVSVQPQANGTVNIVLGGISLVQGNVAAQLTVNAPSAPPMPGLGQVSIGVANSSATAPISGGTVGGLVQAVNSSLPSYSSQFDSVAQSLATQINAALTSGSSYPGDGTTPATGTPLFTTSTGLATVTALNLSVNPSIVADPFTLAAAGSTPTGNNDGSNAQAIAELATTATGPSASWASTVGSFGLDTSNAQALVSSTDASLQNATQAQQAVSGVSTNSQLVDLLNYQQGYQAAAKVISTISTSVQSLLQAI
jgi:flagellar hook-associated protein 1 FlgK